MISLIIIPINTQDSHCTYTQYRHIAQPAGSSHCHYRGPAASSAYARPSGVPSMADMVSSMLLKKERRMQIRRSDSFSPGAYPTVYTTKHTLHINKKIP